MKVLSRFFFLFSMSHLNAKHRREVTGISKAAEEMLSWNWTALIRACFSTC